MNTRAEPAVVLSPPPYVKNQALIAWVAEVASLTMPDKVVWCDGSDAEYDRMCQQLVEAGTLHRLDPLKRPNSYLARSDPNDVARVEDRTFICSPTKEEAGPTNNWMAPGQMRGVLQHGQADGTPALFAGCCGEHEDHDAHG
jgi:phosphoenolpyruvate carboxykinase (GTP)